MYNLHSDIKSILTKIQICCSKYCVNKLYLFGSATTDKYCKGKSDLDFLVDIDNTHIRNLVRLKSELHKITGAHIDIFKVGWINTEEMLTYLNKNKVLIYDKEYKTLN